MMTDLAEVREWLEILEKYKSFISSRPISNHTRENNHFGSFEIIPSPFQVGTPRLKSDSSTQKLASSTKYSAIP